MNTEFIFFDIDNTLLDHSSAEVNAQHEIYSQFPELQQVPVERWLNTYQEVNHNLWLQYQNGEIGRKELQHTRFRGTMVSLRIPAERCTEIGDRYMEVYRNYWRWIEGAEEALVEISEKYPVGFITNGFLETQQKKIEMMELARFSDLFIISEEIGVMKPHRKVFDTATENAAKTRDKILYVGDSYSSDIIGGKNAGWKTAWFTGYLNSDPENRSADFHFDKYPYLVEYLNGRTM
jgi:YjjG family noncanonical pyrimidine nucleotidase